MHHMNINIKNRLFSNPVLFSAYDKDFDFDCDKKVGKSDYLILDNVSYSFLLFIKKK